MLTNNWYKALGVTMVSPTNKVKFVAYNGEATSTFTDSYAANALKLGSNSSSTPYLGTVLTALTLSFGGGVIFGNGDTPPTPEDYKLSSDIVSGFAYSAAISKASTDSGTGITATYTITNTSASAIVIKEIGVVAKLMASNYSGLQYIGLLDRTVLDTPVTIPAGGVGQVVYTITYNYPTAT